MNQEYKEEGRTARQPSLKLIVIHIARKMSRKSGGEVRVINLGIDIFRVIDLVVARSTCSDSEYLVL